VHPSVFVAEGARIYGDVVIGEGSSVWFNAVIRGDEAKIVVGKCTNIQDNAVIHSDQGAETRIGDEVTIGHGAVIRGCRIGTNVMVGMNATVMSHAEIGDGSVVGANAFVPYHAKFPPHSLILGMPAKRVRGLREDEIGTNRIATEVYAELVQRYRDRTIVAFTKA
jgi:carbonic anhydrase/acetyltransferase-like protein (isoleucine patch superfamily)